MHYVLSGRDPTCQQTYELFVLPHYCRMQRRPSILIQSINACTLLQQEVHDSGVPLQSGGMQRSHTTAVRQTNVSSMLVKKLRHCYLAGQSTPVQRRLLSMICGVGQ